MRRYEVEQGSVRVVRPELAQVVAVVVGLLFVVTGVLGVGPGLVDNLVHLGFGVIGLAMSRGARGARVFLIAGGVAYFLLWQFGGVVDQGLVPFRTDEAGIHLPLVASMIGLAVLSGSRAAAPLTAPLRAVAVARETSAGLVRRRHAPNRPRGRGDRHTSPAVPAAYRRFAALVGRG